MPSPDHRLPPAGVQAAARPRPRPSPHAVGSADTPASRRPSDAAEEAQLRDALHLVLNVNVYDGAGRAVTVKDMLRGSLATTVRAALDGKRTR